MNKDEILKKHEDLNEYHFHQVDREFILQAMQEYADQQLQLYLVSHRSEQLKAFAEFCQDNYNFEIPDRVIKDYEQSL